jgi:hypothetical protein
VKNITFDMTRAKNFATFADQRCGALLTPGSGGKKSGSGSGMKNPDHISERLKKHLWGLKKFFKSLMRIRDPGWKKIGPGMGKSRIRDLDPQHWKKHLPLMYLEYYHSPNLILFFNFSFFA